MKRSLILLPAVALLASCSLVTVPVKTVGSVANTTVRTTGKVLTAPFNGRYQQMPPPPPQQQQR
jgi:hypothetical protein